MLINDVNHVITLPLPWRDLLHNSHIDTSPVAHPYQCIYGNDSSPRIQTAIEISAHGVACRPVYPLVLYSFLTLSRLDGFRNAEILVFLVLTWILEHGPTVSLFNTVNAWILRSQFFPVISFATLGFGRLNQLPRNNCNLFDPPQPRYRMTGRSLTQPGLAKTLEVLPCGALDQATCSQPWQSIRPSSAALPNDRKSIDIARSRKNIGGITLWCT
jgi:hypothetical protein